MRLGADPDDLERLAPRAAQLADRLRAVAGRLRSADRRGWHGPAARRWWRSVEAELIPSVRGAALRLDLCAAVLESQARQQRFASMDDPVRLSGRLVGSGVGGTAGSGVAGRPGIWGPPPAPLVVVLVPGVGTDPGGGRHEELWQDAARVWSTLAVESQHSGRISEIGPDGIAVVPWVGYRPPAQLVAGLGRAPAVEGGRALAAAVSAWRDEGTARIVLVGHSYGALVAARAAAAGASPDELVLLGAPGLGVASLERLGLGPGAQVWAAAATLDPVAALARPGLLHGPDPTTVARELVTSRPGHSAYLEDPVTLGALARLALAAPAGQPVRSGT